MPNAAFHRLVAVAAGFRGADQLLLAGTPLVVAALFGQTADVVGLVVAIQGAAWLLVSLPAGVMVDRMAPAQALKRGMAVGVAGVMLALAGLWLGSLPLFALGAFVSASAAVVGFLSESAAVQGLVPAAGLPAANARLQIVQSSAMLAGPALMGYAVQHGLTLAAYGLALALAAGGLALAMGFRPPKPARPANGSLSPRSPRARLRQGTAAAARHRGMRIVLEHGLLRAHGPVRALCAGPAGARRG